MPVKYKKQRFVLLKCEEDGKQVLWVAKVLLFLRLSATGVGDVLKFAHVRYTEATDYVSGVCMVFGCVCLRWVTDNEVDITLVTSQSYRSSQVKEKYYYGIVPSGSVVSSLNFLLSNISITHFTDKLPCTLHRSST